LVVNQPIIFLFIILNIHKSMKQIAYQI